MSFKPTAAEAGGWKLRYYGTTDVKPTDVVEHGAVHLHALGHDGSIVYAPAGKTVVEIVSLDVPVVSAGLLSPFPSALVRHLQHLFSSSNFTPDFLWFDFQHSIVIDPRTTRRGTTPRR